jgi:hypothetical protein
MVSYTNPSSSSLLKILRWFILLSDLVWICIFNRRCSIANWVSKAHRTSDSLSKLNKPWIHLFRWDLA